MCGIRDTEQLKTQVSRRWIMAETPPVTPDRLSGEQGRRGEGNLHNSDGREEKLKLAVMMASNKRAVVLGYGCGCGDGYVCTVLY